ncbi:MAG: V-type ATP synthase subunit F [Bdellovibrio bacteriovorus]
MALCAFLGDELSLLGFRLGGVECYSPAPAEATAQFRTLKERVELILLTAEVAQTLPPGLLPKTQAAERPLVIVIADVRRRVLPADQVEQVRRQLGMAE